ncbi:unnamed protein product [Rotaria sp. Silwood1]|nr:unnamed protein product [Rotaria sp. Silwood1]CAF4524857.1 unnamed protein product [Rotaria sp. Silwood1]
MESSTLTITNTTFLISFKVTSNGNSTELSFEEWSVPVPLKPNLINSTYLCFIDPSDIRRRPRQHKPNVNLALNTVIGYLLIPGSIFGLGVIVALVIFISQRL